jgi:hypothetical protein
MFRRWIPWVALALAPWLAGCSPPCQTTDATPVEYTGGTNWASGGFAVYESSTWPGDAYLHFPGGRHYLIHHELGATPYAYKTYLAFSEHPSSQSESAGNQAEAGQMDEHVIEIFNDTCSEFWLRVVVWAHVDADGGVTPSDAGTD